MARTGRLGWLLAAAAIAALDLWTKSFWAPGAYGRSPTEWVIEGWLAWKPTWNPGGVWSLDLPSWLLLAATALAVPLLGLWLFWPARSRAVDDAGKALLLGGAAGNAYDRLRYGKVRDFIDVYFGDAQGWHWPTFNVADAALVVGIAVLLLSSLRKESR